MAADVSVITNSGIDLRAAEPICRPTNPAAWPTFDILAGGSLMSAGAVPPASHFPAK